MDLPQPVGYGTKPSNLFLLLNYLICKLGNVSNNSFQVSLLEVHVTGHDVLSGQMLKLVFIKHSEQNRGIMMGMLKTTFQIDILLSFVTFICIKPRGLLRIYIVNIFYFKTAFKIVLLFQS